LVFNLISPIDNSAFNHIAGNDRIENWRNIASWLEEAGYKAKNNTQIPVNQLLPENSVVNITNVSIERNQVVILINLRIPTSEVVTENLGN
jgi:hypothetical protein